METVADRLQESVAERLQRVIRENSDKAQKVQKQIEFFNKLKSEGVVKTPIYDVKPLSTI